MVTVVPTSAPMIVATATYVGITPTDTKAIIMESKAPLLCKRAVPNHPANTPVVVSFIELKKSRTLSWPIKTIDSLMKTMEDMKK